MTAQLLVSELSALIQDTKRKHSDVRAAAEKSLSELKALSNTSESQLASDLRRRPEFIRPFLLACKTGNAKYAGPSLISIQRLVAANGLAEDRLEDVLESLGECSQLGVDVQLRVLQIMPSLFQRYSQKITETRLTAALQICFILQASKNAVISNTATATLQQVINDVFTRVSTDRSRSDPTSPETNSLSWQAELDCHRILQDLCLIAEGKPVKSLENTNVPKDFAFELIGTVLLNFTSVIPRYTNFVDILRQQLLPLILRIISSSASFKSTARALRLIPPIVKGFLEILPAELEMLLSMLTYLLEPDAASSWKRVMCMETIREIYRESSSVRRTYALFDERENHKPIIREQLDAISRLASENPTVIGLGQISSLPKATEQSGEDLDGLAALQADPLTATTGVSLTTKTSSYSGIGIEQSSVKVSLIDQLDKSDPPSVPQSYLYALSLTSLNVLSEGLARFVLPFSTSKSSYPRKGQPSRSEMQESDSASEDENIQMPTNPLDLDDRHHDSVQIRSTAALLDHCWPALLSTYSTFFQAALDPEFYHSAIRAFQKLIQVVTLLRLSVPRDAFLTAIAKQSLPLDSFRASSVSHVRSDSALNQTSVATTIPRLSPRNLLCLRALLNLGIALGAVLDSSWPIILNTLQNADIIIGHISVDRTLSKGGPAIIAPSVAVSGDVSKEFSNEVSAVRSAASRMLGSTSDLPRRQFLAFLAHLTEQLRGISMHNNQSSDGNTTSGHERQMSSDSIRSGSTQDLRANVFVLDAFAQVIDFNRVRLSEHSPQESGWSQIVDCLMKIVTEQTVDLEIRVAATESICRSVTVATSAVAADETRSSLISFGLSVLLEIAQNVRKRNAPPKMNSVLAGAEEIHNMSLQTLKDCLDQYGQSVTDGWDAVCELILSAFDLKEGPSSESALAFLAAQPLSSRLLRTAFSSLQSICSDVIESFPRSSLLKVLYAIYLCCSQTLELNISLTATTLYQSVSDHIWAGQNMLDLPSQGTRQFSGSDVTSGQLWMQVLAALCEASAASQSEVRNSAVHACFGVMSSVGEKLRYEDWIICIREVILRLYRVNTKARTALKDNKTASMRVSLDETASSIHSNFCELLEEYCSVILKAEGMPDLWALLTKEISFLLKRESLPLSASVYTGFQKVLDVIADDGIEFFNYTAALWELWSSHNPCGHSRLDKPSNSDNQPALSAFISCAIELYKASSPHQKLDVAEDALLQVEQSLSRSSPTSYVNDLISMTTLQAECERMMNTIYEGTDTKVTPAFLRSSARLIVLPHTVTRDTAENKGPTFVAFVNAAISTVGRCISQRAGFCKLSEEQAVVDHLQALHLVISRKASWTKENQEVNVWRQATDSAIQSAKTLIKLSCQEGYPKSSFKVWKGILNITDVVLDVGSEGSEDRRTQIANMEFDIKAFDGVYGLLIPALGSAQLPDDARHKFAETLMLKSLIHDPHPDDSLDPGDKGRWPQPNRIGRVRDLDPSIRTKLAYILIDRMFDLVSKEEASDDHGRLASAVAPYLLLRVKLMLKAYISDQPLRGRMPCPLSQRQELHHLLQKSIDLVAVATARPNEQQVLPAHPGRSLGRKHVDALKGLAIDAMRITLYDDRIKEAILKVIEV